jgi:hypothetical protein
MAKKMVEEMESKGAACGKCCCGCAGCKNKIWLKALAGLVLLLGGVGVMGFSGWSVTSWFNIWTVIGAYLLLMAGMKLSM